MLFLLSTPKNMKCSAALNLKPAAFHFPRQTTPHHLHPVNTLSFPKLSLNPSPSSPNTFKTCHKPTSGMTGALKPQTHPEQELPQDFSAGCSRLVLLGAASLGVALFLVGIDGQEALALVPEGPLVEEFWENVRRYGLYILTVSTGAIYTIVEPIVELLKNPISAILIITILVGSAYLLSQVLSLMFGISEFAYDYAN